MIKNNSNVKKHPQIIAITSGKGGVGKTNFSVNTALLLSKLNQKVLIIDADIHLGNVDVMFGISPDYTLLDVLKGHKSLKEISNKQKVRKEKLFRSDYKYNYFIVINYNTKNIIKNRGSAIFLHLTKKYKKTAGCIAVSEKDFIIIAKLLKKNSKIKI